MRRPRFLFTLPHEAKVCPQRIPAAFSASSAVSCAKIAALSSPADRGVIALLAVYFPHDRCERRTAIPFRWSDRLPVVVRIEDNRVLRTRYIDLPEDHCRRARQGEQPGIDTAFVELFEEHVRIALQVCRIGGNVR